jgi:integrase
MRRYATRRDGDPTCRSAISFFVGRHGRPFPYSTFRQIFRRLCRRLGWRSNGALPLPRIHDLRHSFACRRLLAWYREGVDVNQALPSLSTYLGHGKVTDTYWYLTGTGELLSVAGTRFERFASSARREP